MSAPAPRVEGAPPGGRLWRATLGRLLRSAPSRIPAALADRATADPARAPVAVAAEGFAFPTATAGTMRLLTAGDVSELREIFVSNMYCAPGFVPRSGATVLDVGANLGLFSAWCLPGMRRGRIIAVEPVPTTLALARANIAEASAHCRSTVAVRLFETAVAEAVRPVELLLPRADGRWTQAAGWACGADTPCAALVRESGGTDRLTVAARPLDAIVEEALPADGRIDLLKVDVEGMEVDCFRGGSQTLRRTQAAVFEYHSPALLDQSSALLGAAGLHEVLRRAPYGSEIALSFWRRDAARGGEG